MAKVNISNVVVKNNPAPFQDAFQFEITFECIEDLNEGKYFLPERNDALLRTNVYKFHGLYSLVCHVRVIKLDIGIEIVFYHYHACVIPYLLQVSLLHCPKPATPPCTIPSALIHEESRTLDTDTLDI